MVFCVLWRYVRYHLKSGTVKLVTVCDRFMFRNTLATTHHSERQEDAEDAGYLLTC